jgi:poly(3-hydroxybutyrate) depolymerase
VISPTFEGRETLPTRPLDSMEMHAPKTPIRPPAAGKEGAQLGILSSPVSRWAAIASSRRVDLSLSIENQWWL